mmetsp:Transcript_32706/g.76678  ORF Transcript_32706/g.76678 Transcript_32706/m.76678 type:complete len:214 (-) Transcript_32706:674-1315(-)
MQHRHRSSLLMANPTKTHQLIDAPDDQHLGYVCEALWQRWWWQLQALTESRSSCQELQECFASIVVLLGRIRQIQEKGCPHSPVVVNRVQQNCQNRGGPAVCGRENNWIAPQAFLYCSMSNLVCNFPWKQSRRALLHQRLSGSGCLRRGLLAGCTAWPAWFVFAIAGWLPSRPLSLTSAFPVDVFGLGILSSPAQQLCTVTLHAHRILARCPH